ncbi:MAG: hypothetical protein C0401_06160 [Anaerolinea sp.]|nr:hypothetical protein [Anaerolinea sp.]
MNLVSGFLPDSRERGYFPANFFWAGLMQAGFCSLWLTWRRQTPLHPPRIKQPGDKAPGRAHVLSFDNLKITWTRRSLINYFNLNVNIINHRLRQLSGLSSKICIRMQRLMPALPFAGNPDSFD